MSPYNCATFGVATFADLDPQTQQSIRDALLKEGLPARVVTAGAGRPTVRQTIVSMDQLR